jgi:Pyruvate/2-oxoacid:ferredoxin oxidoreductase delta subunit
MMDNTSLYEQLAEHLDQGGVGSPKSPALMEILEVLFPVDEAEVAARLPLKGTPLSELKELFEEQADTLEDTLERMAHRGTVHAGQKPGQERTYRLLPSVVGWAETPFWAGKDTDDTRKLAPLWLKYREEAFGGEMARNDMPVMRVLPVSRSIKDPRAVLPFNELEPMVREASYRAVGHCPCRLIKKSVGEGCDHLLENCLHFGNMGRYIVEYGMAREITADETIQILKDAHEDGLVHIIDNVDGYMGAICNCCGCCCVFLDVQKKLGLHTLSTSNYVAQVDSDECAACGTCEERCPMDAIAVDEDEFAAVNAGLCIGCGVCTPTCPTEAVDLELRGEVIPPPELSEFLAARMKHA